MKSTTSKLGIGIIALAMLGGVNGCNKNYSVCEIDGSECIEYNQQEFIKKFKFDPFEKRDLRGKIFRTYCVEKQVGRGKTKSCIELTDEDFEIIGTTAKPKYANWKAHYTICFSDFTKQRKKTDCVLINGKLLSNIQDKYQAAHKDENKPKQDTPITPTGNPDVAHESKKIEEKVKDTEKEKKDETYRIGCNGITYELPMDVVRKKDFGKKTIGEICSIAKKIKEEATKEIKNSNNKLTQQKIDVTIRKVQHEPISFCRSYSDNEACGVLPVKYIFATDNMDSYVFVYAKTGPVKEGSAKIHYQELTNGRINVKSLLLKSGLRKGETPHFPNQTIEAKGLVEKIEYTF
ncbi:hypothetical protein HOK51_04250 [Candidatus Woesearchaeota archaeon]|jgi:hypothetical protein|nr:hypothetical protein [Candidatus Woesearchaeota archaeon]MBT6519034.1 hypothetical protein [Candidatus Woesearchaeota archaeon]MBT7368767.1 hypothetical protein [Candidatus Woesearchaeota archaeon]